MKEEKKATRQSYGEALVELGKKNKNVVVIDADLSGATKTDLFAKEFPDRFLDMGIAENNMFATAAGLATCGKIPYSSTFAVFAAGRSYDQIRNSICYPKLNVKICATHCGVTVGEDGATHQMIEDISLMRTLPNMTVISPSDDVQTKWAIEKIADIDGPVYVRLARMKTPIIYEENQTFEIGKAVQIGEGMDATVFATGVTVAEAIKAQEELKQQGIDIRVVDIHTIKPIDREMIIRCAKETKKLISIEDHNIIGGLGSAISEVLTEEYPCKLLRLGIKDTFGKSGKAEELMKDFGITAETIVNKLRGKLMKTLKFRKNLSELILKNEKTTTWRIFDDKDIKQGDIIEFLVWETKEAFAKAKIIDVVEKKFKELNEKDMDGHEKFESRDEMYTTYSKYYNRRVDENTLVKIIKFELI